MRVVVLLLLVSVVGCDDDPLHGRRGGVVDAGVGPLDAAFVPQPDAARDRDTGRDVGAAEAGEAAPDASVADSGDPAQTDAGAPLRRFKRFIAIGDVGTGSDRQHRVAEAIERVCAALGGCDFGLLLGDNIYNSGVDSADDPLWRTHFELPYGGEEHACAAVNGALAAHELGFPFYAVLGNHDLGGNGLGLDLDVFKADHQIAYGQRNPQWIMPTTYYHHDLDPVFLVGLNTTAMFFNRADDQRSDVTGWLRDAPADRWKIGFGHHPYVSNGPHGNAGDYERIPSVLQRFTPNWTYFRGTYVKEFFEGVLCGNLDVYLSGHDHSRQDMGSRCGTEFLVSGAGAKTTDLDDGDNQTRWEESSVGFLLIEAEPSRLVMRMYNAAAELQHERIVTR